MTMQYTLGYPCKAKLGGDAIRLDALNKTLLETLRRHVGWHIRVASLYY